MPYFSDKTSLYQLCNFPGDELLPVVCLSSNLLLDGLGARFFRKFVLNHLSRDPGEIRRLPREEADILPEKGDERAFLFVREANTDGDGVAAILRDRHLFGLSCRGELASFYFFSCRWGGLPITLAAQFGVLLARQVRFALLRFLPTSTGPSGGG